MVKFLITVLAGGVGASKFVQGLSRVIRPEELIVVVNTGDDIEMFGLHVSPDVDIMTYTLAGLVDEAKGWGFKGDSFNCLSMLRKYGYETWFKLGDMDLATHMHRTLMLKKGLTLSQATSDISRWLGVKIRVLPMSDDRVRTKVKTESGWIDFQEYMVKLGTKPKVYEVRFEGIERADPAPGVIEGIRSSELIIIAPSNPIVSIGPILALKGVRDALKDVKVIAISPIIGGRTVKGPADRMMKDLGIEATAKGVAELYHDFLDMMVIDKEDYGLKEEIEAMGIKVLVTNTLMKGIEDKVRLATEVLEFVGHTHTGKGQG